MILAPNSDPLKSRKHSVPLSHLFSPIKRCRNFKCSPPFLAQTQFLKFHSYKTYIKIYWNFLNTTNLFSFWQSWWCNLGDQLQCFFFFSCHFDTIKIVSIKVGLIRWPVGMSVGDFLNALIDKDPFSCVWQHFVGGALDFIQV